MLALLGSRALAFYCDIGRTPMDTDLLGSYDDCVEYIKQLGKRERILCNYPAESGKKIIVKTTKGVRDDPEPNIYEFEICWGNDNSMALADIIFASCELVKDKYGTEMALPHLNVLYMLKMSHRYRKDSPHFKKTMEDIKRMRAAGAVIPVQYVDWFKEREALTYTNTLPKLNQSRVSFFDNSNDIYSVQHDDIHEAVKHLERPAYEYFKEDAAEVFTSKELFFLCKREVQLYAVLEEVMVLSIERAILPFKLQGEARRAAFDKAHMKLASSISGGWFREFVWENYDTVQNMYYHNYVDKFYCAVLDGRIRKFNSDEIYRLEEV